MFHIAVYVFPIIAILSGIMSLVSVVRFVKHLYEDSNKSICTKPIE